MRPGKPPLTSLTPVAAALLAVAYPLALLWTPLLAGVVVAASVAACSLAVARQATRAPRFVLGVIAAWLTAGFAGAFVLHDHPLGGLSWVLVVLYVLPLPLVPWLYWSTFPVDTDRSSDPGLRSPDPTGMGGA